MLFTAQCIDWQHVAFGHVWQFFAAFFAVFIVVGVFFIHAQEACKGLNLACGAENAIAHFDVNRGQVEFGRGHLAGNRALPNHLVKAELVVV